MLDLTFELHVHDSFDFHPTTTVGADALPGSETAEAAGADEASGDPDASPESEPSDGIERTILTAVVLATVSTVVSVAVARLLSDDDLAELSDLDERETPAGNGSPPRPP